MKLIKRVPVILTVCFLSACFAFYANGFRSAASLAAGIFAAVFFHFGYRKCGGRILMRIRQLSLKKLFFAAVLCLLLVGLIPSRFMLPFAAPYMQLAVTPTNTSNSASLGASVEIISVTLDGKAVDLSSVPLSENWSYNGTLSFVPPEDKTQYSTLSLGTYHRKASIELSVHPAAGIAEISYGRSSEWCDLYREESSVFTADSPVPIPAENYGRFHTLMALCCRFSLVFVVLCLLLLCAPCHLISALQYAAVFCILYLRSPWIAPATPVLVFLLLFSVLCFFVCRKNLDAPFMQAYRKKGYTALHWLICLYASFASFGYRLFLSGSLMQFSLGRLFILITGLLWFYPVIYAILVFLEWIGDRCVRSSNSLNKQTSALKVGLWSSLSALLALSVCFIGFFPGGFPEDLADQIGQTISGQYNNWHPYVHTLILELLLSICDHIGFITFAQLVMFALLIGKTASIAYKCGVPARHAVLGSALFGFLPNNAMPNVSPLKDFMFTYALIWCTLLLLELAVDLHQARRFGFMLQFALSLYFIKELRHNGVIALLFVAAFVVLITIKCWKTIRLRLFAGLLLALSMIGLSDGPLYHALDVAPNAVSPAVTMFCAVGSCVNKDKPLSEETLEKLEAVMPLERWARLYSRFRGHDDYIWGEEPVFDMNLTQFSLAESFEIYFEALSKYPDIVIKDRLDGSNILWDVSQPDESFNAKAFLIIREEVPYTRPSPDNWWVQHIQKPIQDAYQYLTHFYLPNHHTHDLLFDMLMWRSGAYLIFLLVLFVYWQKNRLYRMWWAALPMLGNIASLVLVLYHQSFRYVYFVQPIVLILFIGSLYMKKASSLSKESA